MQCQKDESKKKMPRENPVTRWVFTLNNWTEQEYATIMAALRQYAKYAVVGKETGAFGTPHLQGFAVMRLRERLAGMKRILGTPRMHLEKARGTSRQAADYCKKEDNFEEIGDPPAGASAIAEEKQGMQMRLQAAKDDIDAGADLMNIWQDHFFVMCKFGKSIKEYLAMVEKRIPRKKPRVELLWGAPGTGKTRYVHFFANLHYDGDIWSYGGSGWFDGYHGQKVALFDDFYGDIPLGLFLKVLDRYPVQVPVKGGFVNWTPEWIFITSNSYVFSWYDKMSDFQSGALIRRITKEHFVNEGEDIFQG